LLCRGQYEENNKQPSCEVDGKCAITLRKKLILNYEEQKLMDMVFDFLATKELITKDLDERQVILGLSAYYMKLKGLKDGQKRN